MNEIVDCLTYIAGQQRLEAQQGLSIRRIAFAVAVTADSRGLRDVFLHLYLRLEAALLNDGDDVEELRQATLSAFQVLVNADSWAGHSKSDLPHAR